MSNFDLVILYSGGADSRLLVELALGAEKTPLCILIDYGQKHVRELDFAEEQLTKLAVKYKRINIPVYVELGINSGLTGDNKEGTFEGVHSHNVPGRNSIFLSVAFALAESKGIDLIWYGADHSDAENKFPDCMQEYLLKINEVFAISGVKPIKVEAPLLGMPKELIIKTLKSMDVHDTIFSGYDDVTELADS